ncbi:hypothetical protein PR202_gb13212 [Eleusine coracana subsp. coracana]|uniref:Uncharacterized protein n=1 Tax=Eleusine coracana subsp. coracana TaxID=191504 RepID=A0AAV5ET51_ELECO|nr:hypothetical protein PR202_gb13212 [Eleusine coracana subsp. coracana]
MLGFSTGQLLVILGACSVMMKPSDMINIARTAGRMTGRAVGRLIVARRQLDDILGQSAATQHGCSAETIDHPYELPLLKSRLN